MKDFVKMTLATLLGIFIFGIVLFFLSFVTVGALDLFG